MLFNFLKRKKTKEKVEEKGTEKDFFKKAL